MCVTCPKCRCRPREFSAEQISLSGENASLWSSIGVVSSLSAHLICILIQFHYVSVPFFKINSTIGNHYLAKLLNLKVIPSYSFLLFKQPKRKYLLWNAAWENMFLWYDINKTGTSQCHKLKFQTFIVDLKPETNKKAFYVLILLMVVLVDIELLLHVIILIILISRTPSADVSGDISSVVLI